MMRIARKPEHTVAMRMSDMCSRSGFRRLNCSVKLILRWKNRVMFDWRGPDFRTVSKFIGHNHFSFIGIRT